HRYVRQPQPLREGPGSLTYVVLFEANAQPRSLDRGFFDACIRERFHEGLDHQIFRIVGPPFAKARTAHSDNRHAIPNSGSHVQVSPCWAIALAFQTYRLNPRRVSKSLILKVNSSGAPTANCSGSES